MYWECAGHKEISKEISENLKKDLREHNTKVMKHMIVVNIRNRNAQLSKAE